MSDMPPIPDQPPSGSVRRDRLAALAERAGPSIQALRRRPWLTFLLVVLFVVAAGAISLQWALNAALHTRAEVVVPDLSGKNLEQAMDVVSPMGLSLAKEGVEFDENFPSGAVLRQAPPAGLTVREGKVIRVTISSGGKVAFVPELTGKTLADAQNLLRTAGMAPGALSQAYSQVRPEGEVLEQSPAPGTVGGRGQMVDLKVSKGPPPEGTLMMPDFVNQPLSMARDWTEEKLLKIQVSEEAHPDLAPGTVVRQSPAPDTALTAGQSVSFTASTPGKGGGGGSGARWVRYQVPEGEERVKVKVVLRDEGGEKVLFDDVRSPGALVEIAATPKGPGRVRIYAGGVLVEERVIE
jgi:eukaryotic-like serine/threonine-protein kinase